MNSVYYCRVSTDEEKQINALENQIQECEKCISNMGWLLIDKYVDEGKSGTTTKKRNEYNRLFKDLSSNKFDVVVIKSQDRLMRNTKEWYLFIDRLVTHKKKLYFYLDNKFYTPDDALITGIKAILAEEYSRELSKKINNAHKNRQEAGKSILITNATWGYNKVNKKVEINETEAKIIREIFDLSIQGLGSRSISKHLSNKGVFSRSGSHFAEITIRKIVRNPLYKGTAVMNKKTVDFVSKKTINNTEDKWIYHENAVPAIVPNDIWEKANRAMDTRSKEVKSDEFGKKRIGLNKGSYNLSSKIICGLCGSIYWRRYRRRYKNKEEIIVDWSCSEYVKRGRNKKSLYKKDYLKKVEAPNSGCDNRHIKETDLISIIKKTIIQNFGDIKDSDVNNAINYIQKTIEKSDNTLEKTRNEDNITKIILQKDLLLEKILDGVISDDDYKRKDNELENKLKEYLSLREKIWRTELSNRDIQKRLNDIVLIFSEDIKNEATIENFINYIDKIVIYTDTIDVYFDFFDKITISY